MFKPGTRIVKYRAESSFCPEPGYDRLPLGVTATVTGGVVSLRNAARGADIEMRVDGEDFFCDGWSPAWRAIDGPTAKSAADVVADLAKPRAVPCE